MKDKVHVYMSGRSVRCVGLTEKQKQMQDQEVCFLRLYSNENTDNYKKKTKAITSKLFTKAKSRHSSKIRSDRLIMLL